MWIIERWDTNPKNVTYKSWVFVTDFPTEDAAMAYIKRASSETQLLSYRRRN